MSRRREARVRDAALSAQLLRRAFPNLEFREALVLGSGLGGIVDRMDQATRVSYADLPGFPASGVSGHGGEVVGGILGRFPTIVLSGREHYYERGRADAMRVAIEALALIGVETLVLTNAAGSLRKDIGPGSAVLINDHINLAGANPLIGEEADSRFLNMVDAYDPVVRSSFRQAAAEAKTELHEGVYAWFSGPSFETPAEIRMARTLGADAVGMSTVPEVILARHAGLRVGAVSLITNYGAGMTGEALSHAETKREGAKAAKAMGKLIERALYRIGAGLDDPEESEA